MTAVHRVGVGFLEVRDVYRFMSIPQEGNVYRFTLNSGQTFTILHVSSNFASGALCAPCAIHGLKINCGKSCLLLW